MSKSISMRTPGWPPGWQALALTASLLAGPALAQRGAAGVPSPETAFIFNTFSFLVNGVLVMWMAAGFAMLESGLVRTKNTAAICLKNIALYSVAGIMYYLIGYDLMYTGVDGGYIGSFSLFYNPAGAEAELLGGSEPIRRSWPRSSATAIPRCPTGSSRWSSWRPPRRSSPAPWPSASRSGRS